MDTTMSDRERYIRRQAINTLELTRGFTGEQRERRGNTFHTMEELAGYILELTGSGSGKGKASGVRVNALVIPRA
jgi:hypothetical protein